MASEETIQEREKSLFKLGFARYALGFTAFGVIISDEKIRLLSERGWNQTFRELEIDVEKAKADHVTIPGEVAKIFPPEPGEYKTEKQKMEDFCKSLAQITGPEITDPQLLHILDTALVQIKETRIHIRELLKNV